jgi:dienelactone hydrolase
MLETVLLTLTLTLTAEPAASPRTHLLVYRDDTGALRPVKNREDWAKRRAKIVKNLERVMGPLPEAARKVPLDAKVDELEVKTDTYTRRRVTIAVEKDDRLPCYLFIPRDRKGKVPAVLCLHPTNAKLGKGVVAGEGAKLTAGQAEKIDRAYAIHLAERGYVTLAPDYVNSGEYRFDPYKHGYASATMKGIWNHMRAVDYLQSLPEVDPERIGVIGHSLGGHNSMFLAVFDERVKCAVSNCGFCSFPRYKGGNLAGWSHDGYMPRLRTEYELKVEKVPFDFPEIVAALAPRAFLASAPVHDDNFDVQGVKDCVRLATPVYELFGAKEKLAANYPDCAHNFPPEARKVAYDWLDRWLKAK